MQGYHFRVNSKRYLHTEFVLVIGNLIIRMVKTPKVSPLSNRGVRALASTPGQRCPSSMHPEGRAPLIGPYAPTTMRFADAMYCVPTSNGVQPCDHILGFKQTDE